MRKRVKEVNENGEIVEDSAVAAESGNTSSRRRIDADGFAIPDIPIDPALLVGIPGSSYSPESTPALPTTSPETPDHINAIAEAAIESEIQNIMSSIDSTDAVSELSQAKAESLMRERGISVTLSENGAEYDPDALKSNDNEPEDDLADVDDWEVNSALLTEAETEVKERIWTELNKDYLKEQEAKRLKAARDARNGIVKNTRKRRGGGKGGKKGGSKEMAASPAESAKEMLAKRSYSKKINYAALDHLFQED